MAKSHLMQGNERTDLSSNGTKVWSLVSTNL